jgi:hypothetical protein
MNRLYSAYQLRSVLQLMGLKQLRAHEVTPVCLLLSLRPLLRR